MKKNNSKRSFKPKLQYGTSSKFPVNLVSFGDARQLLQDQIDATMEKLGAHKRERNLIEVAAFEAGGVIEMSWLYPGNPRSSVPVKSAAEMLTMPRKLAK